MLQAMPSCPRIWKAPSAEDSSCARWMCRASCGCTPTAPCRATTCPPPPAGTSAIGNDTVHPPVALWQIMSQGAAVPMVSVSDGKHEKVRAAYELDEVTELIEPFDINSA